jgi:hypothetical protein
VWDVVENEFVILDPTNLTDNDKINKQCNTMSLSTIYNGIDLKVFEEIKDLEKASEVWVRLEETYEGTSTIKSTKLYMLKDKLSNIKMKDDESILEMFYRLQVIINNLKSLGEKVKDEDFSHKFLMCLILRTIIFRGGLKDVSLNEVLGDVMTEDQYNDDDDDDDEVMKEEDKKKKSVAFKADTLSSKNKSKGRAKKEDSSDEECSNDDSDDEALALFVRKFGKMMKGYHIRKKRDHSKNKEHDCATNARVSIILW